MHAEDKEAGKGTVKVMAPCAALPCDSHVLNDKRLMYFTVGRLDVMKEDSCREGLGSSQS